MEWREQSTVSCEDAFLEAQRWVEEVTKKRFGSSSFRSALENGVLLCDLINRLKPGIVKRVNRLSTPIAGLDNVNVFLRACGKLGLKEAQLFHPGDLQDLSSRVTVRPEETNRRLKNVLITIYWLGRKAQADPIYNGPYLKLKAFEGLLGLALSKALEDPANPRVNVRDSGFSDSWYTEKEEPFPPQPSHRREDSLDSLDSVESRTLSISLDTTLKGSSEGCGSDAEADLGYRMTESKDGLQYRRSLVVEPKAAAQFNQFLPTKDKASGYVPAPLRKKRVERQEDNRRSWASPLFTEEDGTFARSKSMNDITVDPEVLRQVRYEELAKIRAQVKENEDQWQNDLSEWKNRRKSVNSSIVKKKEEREQIEQITGGGDGGGGSTRRPKTFREMQEERESRGQASPSLGRRLQSASEDVPSGPAPQPHVPKLSGRSYTVDSLYSSRNRAASPLSPPVEEDREHAQDPELDPTPVLKPTSLYPAKTAALRASPTSAAGAEQPDGVLKTQAAAPKTWSAPAPISWSAPSPAPAPSPTLTTTSAKLPSSPAVSRSGASSPAAAAAKPAEPRFPFSRPAAEEQGSGALYRRSGVGVALAPAVSASLPRSYQRPDSSRLTSVVTPRPFGTQATRIASLPRTFAQTDGSQKRVNGGTAGSSRYRAFMTEDEVRAQASSAHSSEEEEEEDEEEEEEGEEEEEEEQQQEGATPAPLSSTDGPKPKPESVLSSAPKSEDTQEVYCDMRINLNQKPNSGRDFGFQTNWDSTGAFIKSIQEGSAAELCQLRAGDEVLALSGLQVSELSYDQWKASLEAALQKGCLVMDIRRHGRNTWERDPPSLPYKSHKTINLTTMDPTLVGSPDKFINTCRERAPQPAAEIATRAPESSRPPVTDVASKGMNGGFRDDPVTMRNKDSEPISLKNFKRRSEFFEQQGGAESAISDLQVPPVSSSSNRWSWDLDEERRRQEKWQKEQERLLQEKYQRDQEKLEEEWRRAQQEAVESAAGKLEVDRGATEAETRSLSPYSPLSPLSQATPPPADEEEEERERQEVEQQLQREEEERLRRKEELRLQRKREEEEAAKRREAELKERKRREDEERLRRAEELRLQRKREEEEEERRRKLEEEERRRRRQKAEEELRREQEALQEQWAGVESYGFAKILPEMSRSDRAKSKSTPDLDEVQKEDARGASSRQGGMAQWLLEEELQRKRSSRAQKLQAASELEAERRNILNAMKYRNPERVVNSGAGEASWSRDSVRRAGQPLKPAENDRQLILEEMKKKTLLLTDSSWIRQRSASMNKEPASPASPIRRGESLDYLDTDNSWRPPSWSAAPTAYSRPQSAAPGSAPSRGYTRPASSTLPASPTPAAAPRPSSWALNPPVAPYQDRPPLRPRPLVPAAQQVGQREEDLHLLRHPPGERSGHDHRVPGALLPPELF
ncbi:LIM domain only protein 7 isoform X4 [Anguilla anguilla]|uniref:LIM domain only protein 7 isoform X4 n=1 Tax=Anguilla anguilla TaxID=7936 RepID=UPI0015AFE693|nr:LIM domain only protein 7 isoform X4 [Anguilla anguilla]